MNSIKFDVELNFNFDLKCGKFFLKANQEDVDFVISINLELSDGNVDVVVNLDFELGDLVDSPMFPVVEFLIEVLMPVISGNLDFKSN